VSNVEEEKRDVFASYHPIVNFLFFLLVLGITMFSQHPMVLIISFLAASSYAVLLKGLKKVAKFNFLFTLPAMIIVAFVNPAFNHYGVTPLFYLKTGAVTLEAVVYGVVLACNLFIIILWFTCYNEIMTSDKFIYLFGRIIPAMSLVLSMALRFVPKFIEQVKEIRNGQKCVGRDIKNGGFIKKIKYGIKIISILVTWSLENAIETSDSMKARGYGLKGRTAFSLYKLDKRDKIMLTIIGMLFLIFCQGVKAGYTNAIYDPMIKIGGMTLSVGVIFTWLAFATLCFIPCILQGYEAILWKKLHAKIEEERNIPSYLYTLMGEERIGEKELGR
jgi:energy-coupling factor transport system permease protein